MLSFASGLSGESEAFAIFINDKYISLYIYTLKLFKNKNIFIISSHIV